MLPRHWHHSFETSTTSFLRTACRNYALSDVPRLGEERLPHQLSLSQSRSLPRARRGRATERQSSEMEVTGIDLDAH